MSYYYITSLLPLLVYVLPVPVQVHMHNIHISHDDIFINIILSHGLVTVTQTSFFFFFYYLLAIYFIIHFSLHLCAAVE